MQRGCAGHKKLIALLQAQHDRDRITIEDMLFELGRIAAAHPELNVSLTGRKREHAQLATTGDVPVHGPASAGEAVSDVRAADLPGAEPRRGSARQVVRARRAKSADQVRPPLQAGEIYDGSMTWQQYQLPFEREGRETGELPTARPATTSPQGSVK